MNRRIHPFSQRDRVPYRLVPAGTEFLWRGSRWKKFEDGCDQTTGINAVNAEASSAIAAVLHGLEFPRDNTRVTVSRSSGIARIAANAGGHRVPGDYFRDATHYDQKK